MFFRDGDWRTRWRPIWMLILMCALIPFANGQSSAVGSGTKKPATSKTRKKHHSATSKSSSTTHRTSSAKRSSHRKKKTRRVRGQQKIDSERAQQIQEALIREHYLRGDATGVWDQASEAAMRRYQDDHGWQSKTVPDSRALIKLGLGPSKDRLLNPDSAMTTVPDRPNADPTPTAKQAAPPAPSPAVPATPTKTPAGDGSSIPQ